MKMINNLFSIFDPSSSILSSIWISIFIPLIIIFQIKNKLKRKINILIKNFIGEISKEVKPLIGNTKFKGIELIFLSIFLLLILRNIIALTPFTFTPTAHMIISFPTAIIFWLRFILYGWINNTKNIIAHTLPNGTPIILINFMVLIELTRNVIRPLTLSIRLSANIVAGHLLLSLLRNFSLLNKINLLIISPILLILRILEIGVALIQAYVFITLLTLYSTEIH